jgi:argininosuccinate lyase
MPDDPSVERGSVAAGAPLWHGRFRGGPSEDLLAFTVSVGYDRTLWRQDLEGTRAHVTMLARQGLLSAEDCEAVMSALAQVRDEMESGLFAFEPGDEDVHSAIERRTTAIAGPAGSRMHTARSRNDQVATALRLWCKQACLDVMADLTTLLESLVAVADSLDHGDTPAVMPGYTHLQRAQVVLASHHVRAHCWALLRDVDRFRAVHAEADVSPLGAGALGGTSLPVDPGFTAERLGFGDVFRNSMDAVSDRDFVADMLHACAMLGVHLSRLGEEWILWSSAEFGFVHLDDAWPTGSSMLPQKKNPDIAELARGKSGRLIGNLTGFLATLKGLPLAYNRDLQEDKEPLFDSVEQVRLAVRAMDGLVSSSRFDRQRMSAAASAPELAAIDLAEQLVRDGLPFREAHAVIGDLVARAAESGRPLPELAAGSGRFGDDPATFFDPVGSVARRTSPGGAGIDSAGSQRMQLAALLSALRSEFGK